MQPFPKSQLGSDRLLSSQEPVFTTEVFELHLKQWAGELGQGLVPTIDLSRYRFLRLPALAGLLTFGYSAIAEKLSCGKRAEPLRMVLPDWEPARRFLFQSCFFGFAAVEEVFVGANELARKEENQFPLRKVQGGVRVGLHGNLPHLPFQRIIQVTRLGSFENDCSNFIRAVQDTFAAALTGQLGFDRNGTKQFWLPNREIHQNIYMHSGSWGFAAIQCYQDAIILCYADLGVGVLQSLGDVGKELASKEGKAWNDAVAISLAFRDSVTRLPGESQGLGLPNTLAYVLNHDGWLRCRSGTAAVTMRGDRKHESQSLQYLPGVQIAVYLPRGRGSGEVSR